MVEINEQTTTKVEYTYYIEGGKTRMAGCGMKTILTIIAIFVLTYFAVGFIEFAVMPLFTKEIHKSVRR